MKGAVLLEFMYMDLFAFLLHGFGEFEESITRTILKWTEHGCYDRTTRFLRFLQGPR